MNTRIASFAGLAAVAAVLAGCAAQYGNPRACEQEMRQRLANASQGDLSVTHRAVGFLGRRVVIEGNLDKASVAASEALAASAPGGASGAKPAEAEAKPGTPVAVIEQKLGIKKTKRTATAAECTFDESGLKSFHWLAPAALAKTTPDPHADTD